MGVSPIDTRKTLQFATTCSDEDCERSILLHVPTTVSRVADKSDGEWVRCRCGQINHAERSNPQEAGQ